MLSEAIEERGAVEIAAAEMSYIRSDDSFRPFAESEMSFTQVKGHSHSVIRRCSISIPKGASSYTMA